MSEFLVIRLGQQVDDPVSWIAVDGQGTRRGHPGSGSLADAGAQVHDRSVIVLVPGAEVLTVHATIPAKGARLLAALPFALEDQLADDVENLHFAPGKRDAEGRLPVAVVARARMQEWREALAAAGIHPGRMVPDYHGLAVTPNTMSMLVSSDAVMFNDGGDVRFTIPGIAPAEALAATGILEAAADDSDAPRHLLVYCDAALGDRFDKDWALLRQELDGVDVSLLPDGALPRLAVTVAAGAGIDLMQGEYGEKASYGHAFRPWRFAASLLLGFFVLLLLGKGIDYFRLSSEQAALQAQFADEYRKLRPNDTREVVDPVGTVNSLRRSQGATTTGPQLFLPSMMSLAEAIAGNDAARVEAISYRAGVVDVRVNAPDIPTIDGIIQSINASGQFTASTQSADSAGDRENARIQIREAGS